MSRIATFVAVFSVRNDDDSQQANRFRFRFSTVKGLIGWPLSDEAGLKILTGFVNIALSTLS
jgi:hypothetical protein